MLDATLTSAPSSTKNSRGERNPEMLQTKKGNKWHFGMMAHIGIDADSGLVHTVLGAAASVNDVTQGHGLLHGDETVVFADAGNHDIAKRPEANDADKGLVKTTAQLVTLFALRNLWMARSQVFQGAPG